MDRVGPVKSVKKQIVNDAWRNQAHYPHDLVYVVRADVLAELYDRILMAVRVPHASVYWTVDEQAKRSWS